MPDYRTVIFDFDGTLHDCMAVYLPAVRDAYAWLVEHGYREPKEITTADIEGFIGLTPKEMWSRFAPDLPWEITQTPSKLIGLGMMRGMVDGTARLFPGTEEMLQSVVDAGLRPVFLSNCGTVYQDNARKAFGLDKWFVGYYNSEEFDGLPKEKIFETIRQEHEGGYIVVGDRYKDLNVARCHDLPSVGCMFGYGGAEELQDAWVCCDTIEEVGKAILDIANGRLTR